MHHVKFRFSNVVSDQPTMMKRLITHIMEGKRLLRTMSSVRPAIDHRAARIIGSSNANDWSRGNRKLWELLKVCENKTRQMKIKTK